MEHSGSLELLEQRIDSRTSMRQLAVPAMNDSAPEQIGLAARSARERQSSSEAPQRWSSASSRTITANPSS